jgi:hypothetical protein
MFSYNLVVGSLNSKGAFNSSNLFQSFSWELHQIFFKVNKTKKEIGFIIMELNYNDPKGKKVVQI